MMKKLSFAAYLVLAPCLAQAKLNVVATTPDFGSIAREIGGDKVEVTTDVGNLDHSGEQGPPARSR